MVLLDNPQVNLLSFQMMSHPEINNQHLSLNSIRKQKINMELKAIYFAENFYILQYISKWDKYIFPFGKYISKLDEYIFPFGKYIYNLDKHIWQFRQIYFVICKYTFWNWDKNILHGPHFYFRLNMVLGWGVVKVGGWAVGMTPYYFSCWTFWIVLFVFLLKLQESLAESFLLIPTFETALVVFVDGETLIRRQPVSWDKV